MIIPWRRKTNFLLPQCSSARPKSKNLCDETKWLLHHREQASSTLVWVKNVWLWNHIRDCNGFSLVCSMCNWSKINWHLPLNASGAKLKPIYRDLVKKIFFFFCLKQFACFTLSSNWLSLIFFILLWFPALISLGFTTLNRKAFYI